MSKIALLVRRRPPDDSAFVPPDDECRDNWSSNLTPTQWMIARANRDVIAKFRAASANERRHVLVIVRSGLRWQAATISLVETIVDKRSSPFSVGTPGLDNPISLDEVLTGLGVGHVIIIAHDSDEVPTVFEKLAIAEVNSCRVRHDDATALFENRWPGCEIRWPDYRKLRAIRSDKLSSAFYQAVDPRDVFDLLDAFRDH